MINQVRVGKMLNAVTATGANTASGPVSVGVKSFHAVLTGTGAITATVPIEVSMDNVNWITLATITLSGTTTAHDGFTSDAAWAYYRANCTAISGTSATLNVYCGELAG